MIFFFFATMAFTGFKSVMWGIQCLENKHNTDSEASVNRFQPALFLLSLADLQAHF